MDKQTIDEVWKKGALVSGKNIKLFRKDKHGNVIYRPSYGRTSEKGWLVGYRRALSDGGSEHINNLSPLHWTVVK